MCDTIIPSKERDNMTDSEKLDLILEKVTSLENKVTSLENKVTSLENGVAGLDHDVTSIKITIENEIRVNIQRVAEGHLDLSRKLNECIKLSSDIKDKQELQDIYINMHNSKLKAL